MSMNSLAYHLTRRTFSQGRVGVPLSLFSHNMEDNAMYIEGSLHNTSVPLGMLLGIDPENITWGFLKCLTQNNTRKVHYCPTEVEHHNSCDVLSFTISEPGCDFRWLVDVFHIKHSGVVYVEIYCNRGEIGS